MLQNITLHRTGLLEIMFFATLPLLDSVDFRKTLMPKGRASKFKNKNIVILTSSTRYLTTTLNAATPLFARTKFASTKSIVEIPLLAVMTLRVTPTELKQLSILPLFTILST